MLIDKSAQKEESRNIVRVISILLVGVSMISFLRRGDDSSPPRMQGNLGLKASADRIFHNANADSSLPQVEQSAADSMTLRTLDG